MSMTKVVNGNRVPLTQKEEAEVNVRRSEASATKSQRQKERMAKKVKEERQRRLAEGFDYDFGDERGVHNIGTTKNDMEGWNEVTMGSNAAISTGQSDTEFTIVTNTGSVTVKAIEWQDILLAATNFRQPIWQASFSLQQMDPIPTNYEDDSYWP